MGGRDFSLSRERLLWAFMLLLGSIDKVEHVIYAHARHIIGPSMSHPHVADGEEHSRPQNLCLWMRRHLTHSNLEFLGLNGSSKSGDITLDC